MNKQRHFYMAYRYTKGDENGYGDCFFDVDSKINQNFMDGIRLKIIKEKGFKSIYILNLIELEEE